MVPTLSRQDERRGTRRLMLWGAGAAVVLFAACMIWLFAVVPNGELGVRTRGPSSATGPHSNQGSGQSTTAKNGAVLPQQSATGGGGQNANGEAAQIDQGAAPLKLTDAQRQQISSYFAGKSTDRLQTADFAVSIGAAVPAQVKLQKLPSEISSALAGYRGDDFVLVGNQLVIVGENSRRVVAIVPDIG